MYDIQTDTWNDSKYPNFPEMHRYAVGTATLLDDKILYVIGPEKIHFSDLTTMAPWKSIEVFKRIDKRRTGGAVFLDNFYGSPAILSLGGSVDSQVSSREVELISPRNKSFEEIIVHKLKRMDFDLPLAQIAKLGDNIIVIKTRSNLQFEDIYKWHYADAELKPIGALNTRRYFSTGLVLPGSLFPGCKSMIPSKL